MFTRGYPIDIYYPYISLHGLVFLYIPMYPYRYPLICLSLPEGKIPPNKWFQNILKRTTIYKWRKVHSAELSICWVNRFVSQSYSNSLLVIPMFHGILPYFTPIFKVGILPLCFMVEALDLMGVWWSKPLQIVGCLTTVDQSVGTRSRYHPRQCRRMFAATALPGVGFRGGLEPVTNRGFNLDLIGIYI